uniref:ATP synthase complex subunit 8 n=1 Tax=Oreolalax rhodostigmatus TaxID=265045 RepID=A0A343W7G0_9ANUR|nr:ATP synthase F0 subunit 8 [Oreolalax rhodostigmatus]
MPQLDPSPWFFIFIMSWLIFLFIFVYKIKGICPFQKPYTTLIMMPVARNWFWLWI